MINFLFALNSSGAVSVGIMYPLAFLYIVFIRQLFKYRVLKIDFLYSTSFVFLALFSLSYVLIGERSFSAFLYYTVASVLAYVCGWTAVRMSEKAEKDVINYIISMMTGFGIYVVLNLAVNIGNDRYSLIDFWSGSIRVATCSGMLNTIIISSLFYIIKFEKRKWLKFLLLAFAFISVIYMFILGSRTQFYIALICIFISVFIYSVETDFVNEFIKVSLILIAVLVVLSIVYYNNIFGFRDFILSSNLLTRMTNSRSISNSDKFRFDSFFVGLSDLFKYPLGGRRTQMYRHNMWLDVGRVSGIFPFVFLVGYTISTMKSAYKLFRNKSVSTELRYLIMGVYLGVNLNFFFEPVIEGFANFFFIFCIINGMIDALCKVKAEQNEKLSVRTELNE